MQRLQAFLEQMSRVTVYVGGALLLLSALMVSVEVVMRKVFLQSLQGADEFSGYVLAVTVTWAFSYALYRRAHIRIDALYVHLPYRVCCVLDVVALLSLAIFFSIMAWLSVEVLLESIRLNAQANTVRRTPLWIPQSIWVAGLIFFVINIYVLLIRSASMLFRGQFEQVRALAGAPSVTEEIEEELHLRSHQQDDSARAHQLDRQIGGGTH
jgi:TRAP-type C4-dicarboxylate transport system permease small subunit